MRQESRIARTRLASTFAAGLMLLASGCSLDSNDNSTGPASGPGPYLTVAGDVTLQLLELDTDTWREPLGLGNAPNWIVPDGDRLYVVNSISHTLQRFVSEDGKITTGGDPIELGLDRNLSPYAAALAPDGRLLVTNLLGNSLSVVDLDAGEIVEEWPVGRAPEQVLVRDGYAWVINSNYDFSDFSFHEGSVYRINALTGERLDTLAVGINPQYAAFGESGRLHVVCTGNYGDVEGEVWVLNPGPLGVSDALAIGSSPGRISVAPDGTAWIAAGGWSNAGDPQGLILSYDTRSLALNPTLSAGLGVIDVAVDPVSGRLYAACREAMRVDVFEGRELVAQHSLEDAPNAIAVWR